MNIKINKIYQIFIAIFFIQIAILNVNAAISPIDDSILKISVESVNPYPVQPGEDFTVQIRVTNTGQQLANDVDIYFHENPYFYLTGNENKFENLNICSGCSSDNRFYFTVSSNTKSGEYPLIFKVEDDGIIKEQEVFIKVTGKPQMIFNAEIEKENIAPGESIPIKLNLENIGSGTAKNIKVTPQDDNFILEGENLIFIKEISPEKSIEKQINFLVSNDLTAKPHKIKLGLSYENEEGIDFSSEQSIGVDLINNVKLNIASYQWYPEELFLNEYSQLTVRVENLGEGDATNVVVEILSDNLEGNKKAYIGKLKEDEDSAAYFSLKPKTLKKSDLNLQITYKDDLGTHTIKETFPLNIKQISHAVAYLIIGIILLLIVAIAGIYYHNKKTNKKGAN